jgi:hypothetical protein
VKCARGAEQRRMEVGCTDIRMRAFVRTSGASPRIISSSKRGTVSRSNPSKRENRTSVKVEGIKMYFFSLGIYFQPKPAY